MKTSVIQVRDMLSVLSVLGLEERIGKVPGVESVTVNNAAGNATVRYDETRIKAADIKAAVHQSEYQSDGDPHAKHMRKHKRARKGAAVSTPEAAPAPASTPLAAAPKPPAAAPTSAPAAPSAAPKPSVGAAPDAPAHDGQHDNAPLKGK